VGEDDGLFVGLVGRIVVGSTDGAMEGVFEPEKRKHMASN